MHTNIKCIISLFLSCPRPQIRIFNQTQWNYQGSENHVHSHSASIFLAAFLLTCDICPPLLTLRDLVTTLKITTLRTQWISFKLFGQGQSHWQQKPVYLHQRESTGGQPCGKRSTHLPGKGGFSYMLHKHIPNFRHESRTASAVNQCENITVSRDDRASS